MAHGAANPNARAFGSGAADVGTTTRPVIIMLCLLAVVWPYKANSTAATAKSPEPYQIQSYALGPGETRRHAIDLPSAGVWLIEIFQTSIDVKCRLIGADGAPAMDSDAPAHRDSTEIYVIRSSGPEHHILDIEGVERGNSGEYELLLSTLPEDSTAQSTTVTAFQAMSRAAQGRAQGTQEGRRLSVVEYRKAAELWEQLDNPYRQGQTLFYLGASHHTLGDKEPALANLEAAVRTLADVDPKLVGSVWVFQGRVLMAMGRTPEAMQILHSAIEHGEAIGFSNAGAMNNLGLAYHENSDFDRARTLYEKAMAAYRDRGIVHEQANLLNNMGGIHYMQGEPGKALEYFQASLKIRRDTQNLAGEADVLGNIAALRRITGQTEELLSESFRVLEIRKALEDEIGIARAMHNIGLAYATLGVFNRAVTFLNRARELREQLGEGDTLVHTVREIGRIHAIQGEFDQALANFGDALTLDRRSGKVGGAAVTELAMAEAFTQKAGTQSASERQVTLTQAKAYAGSAIRVFRDTGEKRRLLLGLLAMGDIQLANGDTGDLTAVFEEAQTLARAVDDPPGELRALVGLARINREAGRLDACLSRLDQAVSILDTQRSRILNPNLRATYLSTIRGLFELRIDTLMEQYTSTGDAHYARLAFSANEQFKSASFVDLVRESRRGAIETSPDPSLTRQRSDLQDQVQALIALKQKTWAAPDLDDKLQIALAKLDQLDEQVRAARGRGSVATFSPVDVAGVQEMLDGHSVVMDYALGTKRSFLWLITPDRFEAFVLPSEDVIDELSQGAYEEFKVRRAGSSNSKFEKQLAEALFGKPDLGTRTNSLLIVPDGSLHYVPFGALPRTGTVSGERMVNRYAISVAPSVTAILAQQDSARTGTETAGIFLLADPVFTHADDRIAVAETDSAVAAQSHYRSPGSLNRLPYAQSEVQSIADIIKDGPVELLTGFDATKPRLLSSDLSRFQYVHFATHGIVDNQTPELSSLALSLVTRDARPVDGFLSVAEIMDLRLNADLVVLSACDTALGKPLRGEGLVGLTYAFMVAGSDAVVASLWPVADRQTATLMQHFYAELFERGRRPTDALRMAQLQMSEDPQSRDPHYWAGFQVFGLN